MYLHSEFLNPDEQSDWWKHISMYLSAVVPNVKQFFSVGFMGWMGSGQGPLPIQPMKPTLKNCFTLGTTALKYIEMCFHQSLCSSGFRNSLWR